MVQPAESSGTGFGSQVIGSPYRASRSQSSPVVGTPAFGSQVTGVSTSGSSSDEDKPVWEQPSRKKTNWLRDTLKEAQEFGTPREPVRAIQMPDRLDMALVASLCDSEPFTFEEASQHHVWRDAMTDEYDSIMKNAIWKIVPRPEGKSVVTSRWLYKLMRQMGVWRSTNPSL